LLWDPGDGVFGRFDLATLLRLPHLKILLVCLFVLRFGALAWENTPKHVVMLAGRGVPWLNGKTQHPGSFYEVMLVAPVSLCLPRVAAPRDCFVSAGCYRAYSWSNGLDAACNLNN